MHQPENEVMSIDVSIRENKNSEAIDFFNDVKYGFKRQILGFKGIIEGIGELIGGDMTLSPMNDAAPKNDNNAQSKESTRDILFDRIPKQIDVLSEKIERNDNMASEQSDNMAPASIQKKRRERGALTYKQAANVAGVSAKQIGRWKKEPPTGWPGLNEPAAFLKWASEQKNAKIAMKEVIQANHANRRGYNRKNEVCHPTESTNDS